MTRLCRRCGESKNRDEFHKASRRKDGLQTWCKVCQAESHAAWVATNRGRANEISRRSYANKGREGQRARLYGMAPGEYAALFERQDGRCAVCRAPDGEVYNGLHVDHCHRTRRVRGLLCALCNTAIGKFKDDPALLRRASEYLEESKDEGRTE